MAIQVTGFLRIPNFGLICESPLLQLVPILSYPGILDLDVYLTQTTPEGPTRTIHTYVLKNIPHKDLIFDNSIGSIYSRFIDGLENYVISHFQEKIAANQQSIFSKVSPSN
jgi:hypothetical protein